VPSKAVDLKVADPPWTPLPQSLSGPEPAPTKLAAPARELQSALTPLSPRYPKPIAVLRRLDDSLLWATFSPDRTRLLTGSIGSNTLRLWNPDTGTLIATLRDGEAVFSSFSPDGTTVRTTNSKGKITRLWAAETGTLISTVQHDAGWGTSSQLSPNGANLLTVNVNDKTVRLWDTRTGRVLVNISEGDGIYSIAFSPDSQRVAIGSNGYARLRHTQTGELIATLGGHHGRIQQVVFSADGTRLLTGWGDTTARLWNAQTGAPIAVFGGAQYSVRPVFSKDGRRILAKSEDKMIRIWQADSGDPISEFPGEGFARLAPDGTRVVTSSDERITRLWDADSGKIIAAFPSHTQFLRPDNPFSADSERVVISSDSDVLLLVDAKNGASIASLTGWTGYFSPNGKQLLTVTRLGKIASLYDARTGVLVAVLRGHEGSIHSAEFSPDGTRLATLSDDKTARIWDVTIMEGQATTTR
jgi:WD40 repeat protein